MADYIWEVLAVAQFEMFSSAMSESKIDSIA
jgi:hypothetical protein